MKTQDVETMFQRAHEKYPDVSPRIISDNGSLFISKDFVENYTWRARTKKVFECGE